MEQGEGRGTPFVDHRQGWLREHKVAWAPHPCTPAHTPPASRRGGYSDFFIWVRFSKQNPSPHSLGPGGALDPAGPPWDQTSGQTGGPGRQAAENRPWECLSVPDSAKPRGGGGAGRAGP